MKVPLFFKGFPGRDNCTEDIFARGAYIIEGISGDDNFTVDIFVKVPIIFEGIPGRDIYSDVNEQEDCNPTKDQGVEAPKV